MSVIHREPMHDRHTPTRPPRWRTLAMRLALSVALTVAAVLAVLTVVGIRLGTAQLESDLRETAHVTAVAIADQIELRDGPMTREMLVPLLGDFMAAAVDLRAVHVFEVDQGVAVPLISTSVVVADPTALVQRAIEAREETWSTRGGALATVAVPINAGARVTGAVAVTVSLGAVARFRRTVELMALGGGIVTILATTLIMHLRARRLILEPIGVVRRTIATARAGTLAVRADVRGPRELEEVGAGLNDMLVDLESLHASLTSRVDAATEELRQRNEQLVRSYESILRLRETAAHAQQLAAVGQTMANVAHQIGTPLNLVKGHVQLLQQEVTDPVLHRRLAIVEEQVDRVAFAVRALLERATPHGEPAAVHVDAMLRRLSETIRVRLATAGVTVETHCDDDLPVVLADETQLELAVLNLLTNAVDAMPHGGTLTLAATLTATTASPMASAQAGSSNQQVSIEVRDTGVGIPDAMLATIFDPWVTTKSARGGTGLGLSITRDVIARLGGTITVASTLGAGTTFTLTLPAVAPTPSGPLEQSSHSATSAHSARSAPENT